MKPSVQLATMPPESSGVFHLQDRSTLKHVRRADKRRWPGDLTPTGFSTLTSSSWKANC